MFESLSERLSKVFKGIRSHGKLTPEQVNEALREVRLSLLEADVNFKVVKEFIEKVRERAVGQEVLQSLTPGQQVFKIVHEELINLLSGYNSSLNLAGRQPAVIILAGLQGSGKTTTCAKLALFLRKKGRKPYMVSVDVYRPKAVEQLTILGKGISVAVHPTDVKKRPREILIDAIKSCVSSQMDTLLVDTAGRLQINDELMEELKELKEISEPQEVLLVLDAMTGQQAVDVAKRFDEVVGITGFVLTKIEGDARGGAALSIQYVTKKPIKFLGTGEKLDAFEQFYPERIVNRILQMGDLLTLIEKAQEAIDLQKAQELQEKIKRDAFTLEDFRDHLKQLKKIGTLEQIVSMIPGLNKLKQFKDMLPKDDEIKKQIAIIDSMTPEERYNYEIINASRKKRIAMGSGTTVQDVNKLLRQFSELEKLMKKMKQGKLKTFGHLKNLTKGLLS